MRNFEFKGAQRDAIDIRNTDILVSAGAGSGKTTVLVERIIQMITGSTPIDIDRLLVVTFTDAAAQHMRQGVAAALSDKIKQNPRDANLKRQYALINKSNIMTIHSFCLTVARRFFHKIDMDPNFRVADSAEIGLLKAEVLDELFEEYYLEHYNHGKNENFMHLSNLFDARVGDENFRRAVFDVHEFSRAAPDPEGWLLACAAAYSLPQGSNDNSWYTNFAQRAALEAQGILDNIGKAFELAALPGVNPKYSEALEDDFAKVQAAKAALSRDFEQAVASWGFTFSRFPANRQKDVEIWQIQDRIKNIRDSYRKSAESVQKVLVKNSAEMLADITESIKDLEDLAGLVLEFSRRFQAEKAERGIVDFSDFEHFCLQVLVNRSEATNSLELTPEALEIGAYFDEIFIDEYQDSSLIQEMILSSVAAAGGIKRFMVGDVKQCIYQFRMARPKIFWEKNFEYSQNPAVGRALYLMDNFRSRKNIIDSVNFLFGTIMSPMVGGIEYDHENSLKFAATFEPNESLDFRTVVHIVEKGGGEETKQQDHIDEILSELVQGQAEAKIVAKYIGKLIGGDMPNIKYSDIVILLRSKAAAHIFVDELKNHDIPAFCDHDDDYFLATEIMVILAILQIIDNPRQDIPLLTALFSDIFRFSADELLMIGKSRKNGANADFYAALQTFGQENDCDLGLRARDFMDKLTKWREMSRFLSMSQLIFWLYEQTNYYNFVGLLPGGELRRANLMLLFEKATRFEEGSFKGIFNFIRYIEKLQKNKHNLEKARVANENEDLVRVMTIHKSKGLEFPVVFLCQMGKSFNLRDSGRKLVMDYDLGIGLKSLDSARNILSDTFPRAVIAEKIKAEQISEEMRILYVALTRCKEKLFLVGTAKDSRKYADLGGRPTPFDVARGRSYMDWILMALGENPPRNIWDVQKTDEAAIQMEAKQKQENLLTIFSKIQQAESADNDLRKEIFHRLAYNYAHADALHVPAKMSVSEIKRLYFNEFLHDSTKFQPKEKREFEPPAFITGAAQIDSAGRGIIIHTVLEHIDFHKRNPADISALAAHLVNIKLLTSEEAKIIPVDLIANFLNSPLAERMRNAKNIYREIPFVISMPPELVNSAFLGTQGDMMVHGVMDCAFEENGQIVIVDYKTERIRGDIAEVVEKYRPQLEIYKLAAARIFGLKIQESCVYFFDRGRAVVV
ncbi:MAG: helicase-exonuclease AddAB subunit AddA [Clostridiales bacterium]|nr:helicase-exonuclease AddAB subunit AddA [Clostridiales bacterium]